MAFDTPHCDDGLVQEIKRLAKATDIFQVTTFELYRRRPDDRMQQVTVRVKDAGLNSPNPRWHVEVLSDDGLATSGNPSDDLSECLALVHWFDLDK